ncbi:MAG: DUF1320 domain-containing protein [Alphaproteobacteria bacterium]|nr:DUF1320 domain-containing protein [Alphaproteobacteria bacterium]
MYANQQNMVDRFGSTELIEITDREEPYTGAIVASVMTGALEDASAEIDSYIAVRYDLPLPSTPKMLEKVCCDIARKNLYKDRPLEEVVNNYKSAVAWLRDVSKGVSELDIGGTEPAGDTTGAPVLNSPSQTFTKTSMQGF